MNLLREIKRWIEYLGGESEERPRFFPQRAGWFLLAFWWAFLTCLIWVFCGQTSKFIYIDF